MASTPLSSQVLAITKTWIQKGNAKLARWESCDTFCEIWVTARTMPSWCWNRMQTMWNSQRNSFHTFKFDHFKTQERAREFVQNFLKKQGIEVLKANHAFYACWNCVCQVWESPCHYAFWMKLAGRRNHSERDWRKVRGQAQSPARWNCGLGWIKVLLTRVGSEHIGVLEQRCYNWWYNEVYKWFVTPKLGAMPLWGTWSTNITAVLQRKLSIPILMILSFQMTLWSPLRTSLIFCNFWCCWFSLQSFQQLDVLYIHTIILFDYSSYYCVTLVFPAFPASLDFRIAMASPGSLHWSRTSCEHLSHLSRPNLLLPLWREWKLLGDLTISHSSLLFLSFWGVLFPSFLCKF